MSNFRTLMTALLGLGLCACSQAQRPDEATVVPGPAVAAAQPSALAQENAHDGPQSPMTADLDAPQVVPASGTIDLQLRLWRVNPAMTPVTVKIVLPSGATLAAGQASETITDMTNAQLQRTWRMQYAAIPPGDATVIVDWQTKSAGFHAELPYRFGRPEPTRNEPPRLPEVKLPNGTSLGKPILTH